MKNLEQQIAVEKKYVCDQCDQESSNGQHTDSLSVMGDSFICDNCLGYENE